MEATMTNKLPAVHPGEILREEFLVPLGMSAGALARALHVPRTRIERIIAEDTSVSSDTALRLAKAFGTSAEFWMNLQSMYDLKRQAVALAGEIEKIAPIDQAA
jgi:addiction module HigA family antidote